MDITQSVEIDETKSGNGNGNGDTIQRVVDAVVFGIRSGQLVPGQHLVESDLTRRFGVSRGSLREGIRRLSADGIVTLTRYRGAFIAAMDRKRVRDLLNVLEPLCVLAARLAAENGQSNADKAKLCQIAQDLGRHADQHGSATYLQNRRLFYDTMIEMGGNSELGRVIPLARTDLFRAQFESVQNHEQRKQHANGYLRIADAVAEGDPRKAERAVRKHFSSTRVTLEVLPDQAFAASYD